MADLKLLVAKRGQLKSQLTRFSTFVANLDDKNIVQLQTRLEKIELVFDEFNEVQSQIEFLDENESEINEREAFENNFYDVVSRARQLILSQAQIQSQPRKLESGGSLVSSVKLPTLSLPKFYGDYDKWLQFKDTFFSLVHNNEYLDDIQKFYYLLGCLQGNAAKLLQNLEVTQQNYETAWELLKGRYENKPVIIQSHLKALYDMTPLNKESHGLLRSLVDNVQRHIRALRNLGEPVDTWDRILIFMLGRKLDTNTKVEWEEESIAKFKGVPNMNDFIMFLMNRCQLLETVESNTKTGKFMPRKNFEEKTFTHISMHSNVKCALCQGSHQIYNCRTFREMNVASRFREIKKLRLCLNCLRANHYAQDCRSDGCKKCKGKHNTWLHKDNGEASEPKGSNESSQNESTDNSIEPVNEVIINAHSQIREQSQIILSTAIVKIADNNGKLHDCRALLDSGSQSNFMTTRLLKKLNLPSSAINIPVLGVSEVASNIKLRTRTCIKSSYNNFRADLSFLVLDKITARIPVSTFNINLIQIPKNITLADPMFNISSEVDILLGAGIFFDLMSVGQIKNGLGRPILQKSVLGWIISGPINLKPKHNVTLCSLSINQNQDIQDQLEKFWLLEECAIDKFNSPEEIKCEEIFLKSFERDNDGRFIVTLPIRDQVGELGDSLQNAIKRFYSLEKRLAKNPEIKKQYCSFMTEYETLGHMSQINDLSENTGDVYYLPHHCVTNEASSTTKLRVVFDGSAKTSTGISLNDRLMVGPMIQEDLFSILTRFRKHEVVLVADVEKMFRQVLVTEKQRDLQRIVWRANQNDDIKHYRCNTVTYGTGTASYLAIRCLQQTARENIENFPKASKVILRDFYVDDLISGANTTEEALTLKHEVTNILAQGGFNLRKWVSNNESVLEQIKETKQDATSHYYIASDDIKKTLGVFWNSKFDTLGYVVRQGERKPRITKRLILSSISQIFDPLGLIGPCTIQAKIILQQIWQLKLGWDEGLPTNIFTSWSEFYKGLLSLNEITIPRKIGLTNSVYTELHGFCDSSEKAYGCCIYVRTTNELSKTEVRLLCAKSRVAPLKLVSLPRLELCGAVLLARLMKKI